MAVRWRDGGVEEIDRGWGCAHACWRCFCTRVPFLEVHPNISRSRTSGRQVYRFSKPLWMVLRKGDLVELLLHTHHLSLPLCKFIFTKCNVSQLVVVVCLVIYFILILSCLKKQYVISRKQCSCVIYGQLLIYRWLNPNHVCI
jgi:hypothetical protein